MVVGKDIIELKKSNIYDQIKDIVDDLKPEIFELLEDESRYIFLSNEHIYYCAMDHCGKLIEFPEIPFIILNEEGTAYTSYHYQCAFRKDSELL